MSENDQNLKLYKSANYLSTPDFFINFVSYFEIIMDKKDKPKRKRIEDYLLKLTDQKYTYEFIFTKPFENKDNNICQAIDRTLDVLRIEGYEINSFMSIYTFKYESDVCFNEGDKITIGMECFYVSSLKYNLLKRHFTAFLNYPNQLI